MPDNVAGDVADNLGALGLRHNLRDLGGCRAADGRRVRRGLVYRAASLAGMAAEDVARLHALGIVMVIDLRSAAERERAPAGHALRTWTSTRAQSSADHATAWHGRILAGPDARDLMIEVYRNLPEIEADAYATVFASIADGAVPLVFHCAAGKDRTGVCAALLLDLLGLPREAIMRDYVKTAERVVAESRDAMLRLGVQFADEAALAPILHPDPVYLEAMFASLAERYGSTARYCEERLGLHPARIGRIKDVLLEDGAGREPVS